MSTKERYFDSLDTAGRQRYLDWLDKLFLLSLSVVNDPLYAAINLNSKTFVRDMSLWPPVEFGHILCLFINCARIYMCRSQNAAMEATERLQLLYKWV